MGLEKLLVYNPYSGVTNNQSEGLNRVMKELQGWKEAPIDCMLLALYHLQAFYLNEIRRGLAGMGEYHLTEKYNGIQLCHETPEYISCSSPAEIVNKIRQSSLYLLERPHTQLRSGKVVIFLAKPLIS